MTAFNVARAASAVVLAAGLWTAGSPAWGQDKMMVKPKQPAIGGLKAPTKGPARVTCGPKTCTCTDDDDCDALFTSTKCKSGTAVHNTRTSTGECQAAN